MRGHFQDYDISFCLLLNRTKFEKLTPALLTVAAKKSARFELSSRQLLSCA